MNLGRSLRLTASLGLLLLAWARMVTAATQLSPVVDEQSHISRGLSVWRTGELRLTIGHPLLLHLWQALPLAADRQVLLPTDDPSWLRSDRWDAFGDAFLWRAYGSPPQVDQPSGRPRSGMLTPPRPPADGIVFRARVMVMLLALVLLALVFRWAADIGGAGSGLFALLLASFDPNLLAHGGLATTDLGVTLFVFAATWALWRRQGRPQSSHRWTLLAGLLAGAAFASKFSALVFAPLWIIMLLRPAGLRPAATFALAAVATVVLVYAGHVDSYVADLRWILGAAEEHPAFLLGQLSAHGWWYYFPVTFVLKTPLAAQLLMAWAAVVGGRRRWRQRGVGSLIANRSGWTTAGYLLAPPLLYGLASIASGFNIGYRHLLPLLPFAFVATAASLSGPTVSRLGNDLPLAPAARRLAVAAAFVWLVATSLAAHPNYLAYFNALAPRPYEALVDSNLDWGQGLRQLSHYLASADAARPAGAPSNGGLPYLSYFGPGDPEAYGIRYEPLPRWPPPRRTALRPANPAPGVYIISATNLQGVLLAERDSFDWFRRRPPDATLAGGSLLVYHVARSAELTATTLCEAPWTPVEDDEVARILGPAAAARVLRIDCGAAWLWPAGVAAASWMIAPPEVFAARPFMAQYEWLQFVHTPDTTAGAYAVWRQHALTLAVPLPHLPRRRMPIGFDSGLRLLGTDIPIEMLRATPGATATVMTAWEVAGPIAHPISVFGHLRRPDGSLVAGSDGFGAPYGALARGDVIGIRHQLRLPADTPPGQYAFETGCYRLDNGERYHTLGEAEPRDAVPLGELAVAR